jgi:hypothetical protein
VHARAAADRLVFVHDRRAPLGRTLAPTAGSTKFANAAPAAFRNLTQWEPQAMTITRDIRVTDSALGNQRRVGVQAVREVNGLQVIVEVSRHILSTLAKTLLPLALLTLIMYASLHFPHGLVKEKVTVAITAALSGAVLLAAINAQLGSVGYLIAVEFIFYIFFALCLLCIVSVLAAERLRAAGKTPIAVRTEAWTRMAYVAVTLTTMIAAWLIIAQGMT